MKLRAFIPFIMPVALWHTTACPAQVPDCLTSPPVPITVRIGDGPPVPAKLEGGISPPLQVVAADSGRLLWSAGAAAPVTQQFEAMDAAFAGSLIALDTDGDGLEDRLYAGDFVGRLWRFDLHAGADATHWATGGVFADFRNAAGRGFLAAPDVSLASDGRTQWFDIALGTASITSAAADNRYYVLRDTAPFEAWSETKYRDWPPLREADLLQLTRPDQTPDQPIEHGYFIALGTGQVLAPALTVSGRAVLAIADSMPQAGNACKVAVSVAILDLDHAHAIAAPGYTLGRDWSSWRMPLPTALPADAAFTLTAVGGTLATCTLGDTRITACDMDTRPRRSWWRREDAE